MRARVGAAFRLAALAAGVGAFAPGPAGADPALPRARDDYSNAPFTESLRTGMRAFFRRDFGSARSSFERALAVVPDNTLAMSFLNATALQSAGAFDALVAAEEDALAVRPRDYLTHLRLAFSYLFAAQTGRDRAADAREELEAALRLDPDAQAAHVGLGILRETERSKNRAKVEFLIALRSDPNNVLAREYLSLIYQDDLKDPQRGLAYVIDIPNLLPEYADIDYHIASLLDDLDQPAGAITYATRGLEADVGHVGEAGQHGYTLLARIYLNEKRTADARRVLKASIAADTDTAYAQTLLRKIDRGDYPAARAASSPEAAP